MRPLAVRSSWLRQPLDEVLGTGASVRVVRVLALDGDVLPATTIAKRARVTLPNARRTLGHLAAIGVVDRIGTSRTAVYRLRRDISLTRALMRLFRKEARRPDVFLKRVRRVSKALTPVPMAVWLFGSAARLEDTAGGDIDLAVIGPDEKTADRAATALREALVAVEAKLGVTASVLPMALSKVKHVARAEHPLWLSLRRDAIPLMGPLPDALIRD